jgi:hypothetical protein
VGGVEEGSEEAVSYLGVEHSDTDAFWCGAVSVGSGDPFDEAVESHSTQVVAHLVGGVVVSEESGDTPAKAFVGETGDGMDYDAERTGQGHGALVPEAERSGSLALGEWLVETVEYVVSYGTAL